VPRGKSQEKVHEHMSIKTAFAIALLHNFPEGIGHILFMQHWLTPKSRRGRHRRLLAIAIHNNIPENGLFCVAMPIL
jgi:hypothetical protein